MSMLAEKKRREKWSLNPRGKAWSEDQNKFGQRLMEKMGWKAGQGLGVNSQGPTDIVKARLKNDSKGLGFKENGEEWLKTTSDFDNLLDELASNQEDSGEGGQSDKPLSLEDRSKKSRARVHYHKFTRGKDLSRYSEKDLASIIGPDAVKVKNSQESINDYTQNQINKGSLEEYFNKKSKSKGNKPVGLIGDDTCSDINKTIMKSKSESRNLNESTEHSKESTLDTESEVVIPSKKKKKKEPNSNENEAEVNRSTENSGSSQLEVDQHNSQTEVPSKKKKKRKNGCDPENSICELEENYPDRLNSATSGSSKEVKKKKSSVEEYEHPTESSVTCEYNDEISKKRKRKRDNSPDIEGKSAYLENITQTEKTIEEKPLKKKRQTVKGEDVIENQCREEYIDNNHIIAEANSEISSKKKKKSKNENKEHQEDSVKEQTEYDDNCTNDNPAVSEAVTVGENESKRKKKKSKYENKDLQEDPLVGEQTVTKKKHKKEKKSNQLDGETEPGCEQVVSPKKPGDLLEVYGRQTRLKNINIVRKSATPDSYETEEFMSFAKPNSSETTKKSNSLPQNTDDDNNDDVDKPCIYIKSNPVDCNVRKDVLSYENKLVTSKLSNLKKIKKPCVVITDCKDLNKGTVKKLEELHRIRYYKSFLSEQDVCEIDAALKTFCESKNANQNSESVKPKQHENKVIKSNEGMKNPNETVKNPEVLKDRCINNNYKMATSKEVKNKVTNEKADSFKCYGEINTDDCNVPKHVVAYEYRLVTARLKRLQITPPDVKVVIKESNTLNATTLRKLKQITKTRHLKMLLPPNEVTDIDTSVSKFYDNLKPKIEIMTIASNLEEKILEFAKGLDEKTNVKENEDEAVNVKSLLPEKVEELKNLVQKLETFLENLRNTKDETIISGGTVKESSDAEDEEDKIEPRCLWLKRVEGKLDILKEHIKMLAEGKIPPVLKVNRESQSPNKKNTKNPQQYNSHVDKNHYQNSSYSRGRIAHNIGNQRGRGRGFGRGQSTAGRALPSGGWGILKSHGSGTEQGLGCESQNFKSGGYNRGGFVGQGRGGLIGQGRGGFIGQGRRGFIGPGRGGFIGQGRRGFGDMAGFIERGRGFMGRGRGYTGRGRGRDDMRGRGRISQNNFDAKLYAEKCKELNKIPDICFNGVNIKVISGYAADVSVDKNSASNNESQCLNNQPNTRELTEAVGKKQRGGEDATKKVPGGFSEVVVKKENQSRNSVPSPKRSSEKGTREREGFLETTIKKEPVELR